MTYTVEEEGMTAEQAIKYEILQQAFDDKVAPVPQCPITQANIDQVYEECLVNKGLHWGYEAEFRCHGEETHLTDYGQNQWPWSRYCESKFVAAKLRNGKWVGWIYWSGGERYVEAKSIPWMPKAQYVECSEREETIIVREFQQI